jgi:hypothetical protein
MMMFFASTSGQEEGRGKLYSGKNKDRLLVGNWERNREQSLVVSTYF